MSKSRKSLELTRCHVYSRAAYPDWKESSGLLGNITLVFPVPPTLWVLRGSEMKEVNTNISSDTAEVAQGSSTTTFRSSQNI